MSDKLGELNRLLAKMNLQVDNPVCILNQETAKNFLHSNDPQAKFKLFERATQLNVIYDFFATADQQLEQSKSCLEEKKQALIQLQNNVKKLKAKKRWYDSMTEIHGKQTQLENMIAWAEVEIYEKKAEEAAANQENQRAEIEKVGNVYCL